MPRQADKAASKRRRALLPLAAWAALACGPAIAQDDEFRLALEVIVFLQLDPEATTEDLLEDPPVLPPPESYPEPVEWPDAGPETPKPPSGMLALTRAQYAMDGIWTNMARSAGYRPLAHFAWAVPADWTGEPASVRLSTLTAAGLPFSGRVTLEEERVVEVTLDIRMPAGQETPGVYRIAERRRLLLGETHYFDHPRFGAIVRMFRYRPRPEADPGSGSQALFQPATQQPPRLLQRPVQPG